MSELSHRDDAQTKTTVDCLTPVGNSDLTVNETANGRIDVDIESLAAVTSHNEFVCVDSLFYCDEDLYGAKSKKFVPVYEDEHERRKEEYRDYEWSPLAHIYDETETTKSWDEWISQEMKYDEFGLLYDESYVSTYKTQLDAAHKELHGDTPFVWECVSSGRMRSSRDDYQQIFDPVAIHLADSVENGENTEIFEYLTQ